MAALGDGLMSTPAIRAYKKSLPADDQVVLVTGTEGYQDVYDDNPYIDSVMKVPSDQYEKIVNRYGAHGVGKWGTYNTRGGKIDKAIVIDTSIAFTQVNQSVQLVSKLSHNGEKKMALVVPHMAHGYAHMLGVDIDSTHYDVSVSEEEYTQAKSYMRDAYGKGPYIVAAALSTSCTSRSKKPGEENLPPNKMLGPAIWDKVMEDYHGYTFIFVCAKDEKQLELKSNKAIWEAGLPIKRVAAMCKLASCVVSIDTGIGHLAQAVDANIVSVCAAVPRTMTAVDATKGKYYCVDHTQENPWAPKGISSVTAEEIVKGIREVTKD